MVLDEARGQATGLGCHAQETTEAFGERIQDALAAAKRAITIDAHGLTDTKSASELVDVALSGALAGNAKAVLQDVLRTGDKALRKEIGLQDTDIMGQPT